MSEEGSIRIAAGSPARDSASALVKLRPIGSQKLNHTCAEGAELLERLWDAHSLLSASPPQCGNTQECTWPSRSTSSESLSVQIILMDYDEPGQKLANSPQNGPPRPLARAGARLGASAGVRVQKLTFARSPSPGCARAPKKRQACRLRALCPRLRGSAVAGGSRGPLWDLE
jgi:hypothetical protein